MIYYIHLLPHKEKANALFEGILVPAQGTGGGLFYRAEAHLLFNWRIRSIYSLQRGLTRLEFEPVTILSGGNGSGKTTALNIMAQALKAKRTSPYNSSAFFEEYVNMCSFELDPRAGRNSTRK